MKPIHTALAVALLALGTSLPARTQGQTRAPVDGEQAEPGRAIRLRGITDGIINARSASDRPHELAMAAPAAKGSLDPFPRPHDIIIDLIVAYTDGAAAHYRDIERELVLLAVESANASFRASNLGHIRLRLAHAYRTDYVEEGTHFDHVWRFADKGDHYMDEVHDLRDRYRADVAILIVDDPQGCGLATRVRADAEEAFAVVHHECAAANYTVAHEVGHLIGARHELGYVNGTKWRDIMGYKESCGGCPRLPVWSSPTVFVAGEPAGTALLDNARVIAEEAARVAAFRD
jgi:hypothetical protein